LLLAARESTQYYRGWPLGREGVESLRAGWYKLAVDLEPVVQNIGSRALLVGCEWRPVTHWPPAAVWPVL